MRRSLCGLFSAAALGLTLAASGPAFATPTPRDALASAQSQAYPGESFSRKGFGGGGGGMRHGGGGGHRVMGGGHRGGFHAHGHRGGRGGRGAAGAAIGLGLAAGLLGAAIASQQPTYAPAYGGGGHGWNRYCFRRFGPSFDPGSGTYLASDGYRYPCR